MCAPEIASSVSLLAGQVREIDLHAENSDGTVGSTELYAPGSRTPMPQYWWLAYVWRDEHSTTTRAGGQNYR